MIAATPDRWGKLWARTSGADNGNRVFEELLALYSQPHRHYHNLRHIDECLVEFDAVRHLTDNEIAVELAIWFHDAVYDTHAWDNEERSAELARQRLLAAGGAAELCESVVTLILATKTHAPAQSPDASLLVDLDLSILGKREDRFREYEARIRREYDWVLQEVFAAKRAEILRQFMARARIYATEELRKKYERQARINLRNSISRLIS